MKYLKTLELINLVASAGSIRKAAEEAFITPSALHRRIQGFEYEVGCEIFERIPSGVRLNSAGELVINYFRQQRSESERLKSNIAALANLRTGKINIACSQALTSFFLPHEIFEFRRTYPGVSFNVVALDHFEAEKALADFSVDLALIFELYPSSEIEVIMSVSQPLCAVMSVDHPLASNKKVRLWQCAEYPLALPASSFRTYGLLKKAAVQKSIPLEPKLVSNSFEFLINYVSIEKSITFQIPLGIPRGDFGKKVISIPVSEKDIDIGILYLAQKRGRSLPAPAAKFSNQLVESLTRDFDVLLADKFK